MTSVLEDIPIESAKIQIQRERKILKKNKAISESGVSSSDLKCVDGVLDWT